MKPYNESLGSLYPVKNHGTNHRFNNRSVNRSINLL